MQRHLPVIGALVFGAIAGCVLWTFLNSEAGAVGWIFDGLRKSPLNQIALFAAVGAILGVAAFAVNRSKQQEHDEDVAEIAGRMGLAIRASAEEIRDEFPGVGEMGFFQPSTEITNCFSGQRDGKPMAIFDASTRLEESTRERTVVLLPGSGLPELAISPRNFITSWVFGKIGLETISFEPARGASPSDVARIQEFNRRYVVTGPEALTAAARAGDLVDREATVRRLFVPDVMATLTRNPGWCVESVNGHLALWRERGSASGLSEISFGSMAIRLPLGSRRGFLPASERPEFLDEALAIRDALRASATADPAAVKGATSWLAEPASRIRKPKSIPHMLLFAGAMPGFLGGGMIGAVLLSALEAKGLPFEVRSLLFFGGAILGGACTAYLTKQLWDAVARRRSREPA